MTSDSEGTVRLWDAATGALRTTWTGPERAAPSGGASPRTASASRRSSTSFACTRWLADGNGEPAATLPFVADGGCLEFSPDGTFLAAGRHAALMVWAL